MLSSPISRCAMLRFCNGLSNGPSATSSTGTPISTTRPSVTEAFNRMAATTKNDTSAPAARPITSMELPTWAGRTSRSRRPHRSGPVGAASHPAGPHGGPPAARCGRPRSTSSARRSGAGRSCGGLDDPHAEQCQRPEPELAHVLVGDARIDGLADDRGHDRLGHHPDRAEGDAADDRRQLPASHPPQVTPGRADVGCAGVGQREERMTRQR